MTPFLVSPEAEDDVWSIWRYLTEQSDVSVADHLEAELFQAFAALARMPGMGHRRSDLTNHGVYFFGRISLPDRLSEKHALGNRCRDPWQKGRATDS